MKKITFILLAAAMMMAGCKQKTEPVAADTDNIYQFSVLDGNLDTVSLSDYQGKVLLVVNTATQCGFTPQYEDLQQLYAKYHDRGFEVLDFPCNQFGEQAPGSYEEIHGFCTMNYNITFPQMAKIEVNGEGEEPLYTWLKEQAPFGGFDTTDRIGAYLDQMFRAQDSLYDQNPDIKWNFTKFLIGRDGKVVKRFEATAKKGEMEAALVSVM
ncbi:MAG: glutathione peroxidase [Bacteroidales bacterium]|nr:glutathione peroxidase [Bacteroidales bacterium]